MLQDFPEVITVEGLMEILLIGRNTAYRLIRSGEINAIKIGHTYRIPILSVKEYILRSAQMDISKYM
ncbi:helix-turn-helix domain-containing protein [Paenibacillus sp. sgz302251]|uniref:helix-turn-helix domain-containing protein n=1 Tax=Paenibacillus sp. sgz302251 TaxID=3414493 RepID=UPI003C7BDE0E